MIQLPTYKDHEWDIGIGIALVAARNSAPGTASKAAHFKGSG